MRSKITTFLTGIVVGMLLLAVAQFLPRVISLRHSHVPIWNREQVAENGFSSFRKGEIVLGRWDVGQVADECLADFHLMALGVGHLGLVYGGHEGKFLVLMFSCDRDQWGTLITDRVIAYVYDTQAQKIVGKFWVPMA